MKTDRKNQDAPIALMTYCIRIVSYQEVCYEHGWFAAAVNRNNGATHVATVTRLDKRG